MSNKKTYRKYAATTMAAAAAVASVAPVATAADTSKEFSDVNEKNNGSHIEAIYSLVERGIITGYDDNTFRPANDVSRLQVAKMIQRALELDVPENAEEVLAGYSDLDGRGIDQEGLDAIAAVTAAGYLTGSNGQFDPTKATPREQMATILVRAYDLEQYNTDEVEDKELNFDKVSASHRDNVQTLVNLGISTEAPDFRAWETVTREQFATFLYRAINFVEDAVEDVDPAVESVSAINATQVEVKFTVEVDKDSLFDTNGDFKVANLTFTGLDNQNATSSTTEATLSEDGKTLVVTVDEVLAKRYQVVIDNVETKEGEDVAKFDEVLNFAADTTAPTIVGTEKLNATQVKVKFSEPIKALNTTGTNLTFKDADGKTIAIGGTGITVGALSNSDTEVLLTLGTDVPANKEITATFVGVQDKAGNVMTPNPATVVFQKGDKDGVAPAVSGITQTGAKTFTIKFSEPVQQPGTADVTATPASAAAFTINNVKQVGTDSTTFEFTTNEVLDGVTTVASANPIVDLSGEEGIFSQVVSFVKDEVAPEVVSAKVVKDTTDAKEYLEITFDKDVEIDGTSTVDATGSYVKDYITTQIGAADITATTVSYKSTNNKKLIRVDLDTFLGTVDVKDAVYELDLTFANIESGAGAAVTTGEATFTRGEDGTPASSEIVKVDNITQGSDNDKVDVEFDQAVDGASATNPANYKVDGAVVESVTLKAASGAPATQVATLNLKKDSNTFSGTRNVTVQNVKALNSTKIMDKTVIAVDLAENVRPTVKTAVLSGTDEVTLTFSEPVDTNAVTTDFELLIGGSAVASNNDVNTTNATNETVIVFELEDHVTAANITSGLSFKALSTLDIRDAAGNNLYVPSNITIAN